MQYMYFLFSDLFHFTLSNIHSDEGNTFRADNKIHVNLLCVPQYSNYEIIHSVTYNNWIAISTHDTSDITPNIGMKNAYSINRTNKFEKKFIKNTTTDHEIKPHHIPPMIYFTKLYFQIKSRPIVQAFQYKFIRTK